MKKRTKKKEKINIQKAFCLSSFIFILTCILWYGGRFIYYYLDNHKDLVQLEENITFANTLKENNYESSNFKQIKTSYYFYGDVNNNYVNYSNMLWRIVKINADNTILLVSDSIIGTLAYGDSQTSYQESNLINWLNNETTGKFIKILNNKEKYLNNTKTCIDTITNMESITCQNKSEEYYLGLLSLEDYLSAGGNSSFINNEKYSYLANKNNDSEIWYITNEGKLATTDGTEVLGFKTTITLNANIELLSGTGTIDNPYTFEESTGLIGSYVKLGNDIWRIYEEENGIIKLISQETIKNNNEDYKSDYSNKNYYHNDTDANSLAYYLNKNYYQSLSYKDLIIENTYINGLYDKNNNYDYKEISTKTIKTKVSLPSINDVIFNDNLTDYFTNTGKTSNTEAIYIRKTNGTSVTRLITTESAVVPCISIEREKLTVGSGTKTDPYRTEQ